MPFNLFYFKARHVVSEHELDQVTCVADHVLGHAYVAVPYLFHDGARIACFTLALERREAANHLTDQNAPAPDVCLVVVAHLEHDLRSTVTRCAAVRKGAVISDIIQLLGKAKVDQLNVALLVDEYVFGLEVAVYYVHLMQLLDAEEHFSEVEAGDLFIQLCAHVSHQLVQLAAGKEL